MMDAVSPRNRLFTVTELTTAEAVTAQLETVGASITAAGQAGTDRILPGLGRIDMQSLSGRSATFHPTR